jgi:Amt family ammonium transporter
MVIGLICGVLVIEAVFFVERRLKLDDPVGAIAVHGVCGIFGVLAVGIFPSGSYGAGWNGAVDDAGELVEMKGILYGSGGQFMAQLIGAIVICTVMFGLAYAFFKIQDSMSRAAGKPGIRSVEDDEVVGLDLPEMGVLAYPEFSGHGGVPSRE